MLVEEAPVSWEGFNSASGAGVASAPYADFKVEGSASGGTSYIIISHDHDSKAPHLRDPFQRLPN
jgi:hypothetical protein